MLLRNASRYKPKLRRQGWRQLILDLKPPVDTCWPDEPRSLIHQSCWRSCACVPPAVPAPSSPAVKEENFSLKNAAASHRCWPVQGACCWRGSGCVLHVVSSTSRHRQPHPFASWTPYAASSRRLGPLRAHAGGWKRTPHCRACPRLRRTSPPGALVTGGAGHEADAAGLHTLAHGQMLLTSGFLFLVLVHCVPVDCNGSGVHRN